MSTGDTRPAQTLTAGDEGPPRIWLLLGDKIGDNRQVEQIAESLGRPFELRRLSFVPRWRQGKPPFLPLRCHVDRAESSALEPPWPDLILTCGRRPAMVALWIRARSGGRTRLVLVGRPKRFFKAFSLIVAPAQYRLPERDNLVKLGLPLLHLDEVSLRAQADAWRPALADLPRPLTVLLVGGRTRPYRLDAQVARELLAQTLASMPEGGGLYVSTSRRTSPEVVAALREALPAQAHLYAFTPEAVEAGNPYPGLLGLGDRFVVTGDSVSMLTEIAHLGLPLEVYPLPPDMAPYMRLYRAAEASGVLRALLDPLRYLGLLAWPRNLTALHNLLIAKGWATRLGEGGQCGSVAPPEKEIEPVVARVRALLEGVQGCSKG